MTIFIETIPAGLKLDRQRQSIHPLVGMEVQIFVHMGETLIACMGGMLGTRRNEDIFRVGDVYNFIYFDLKTMDVRVYHSAQFDTYTIYANLAETPCTIASGKERLANS